MRRNGITATTLGIFLVASVLQLPTAVKAAEVDPSAVKVGLVLSGTLGDYSVHDQAYAGLLQTEEDFGVEIKYLEVSDSAAYADSIESLCEAGYDLVCCDAFSWQDALESVAPLYPDVHFMILDTNVDLENVTSFTYNTHECSFLAGVVAAMSSESDVIGFIGGMEIPTIQRFEEGFKDGVAYINPEATVISKYVGNDSSAWNDPATAKSLTLEEINSGADVCYHAAGASGLGMIEACKEQGIYAIGVNVDQTVLGPETVLTSALTKGDRAIYLFVESYLNGDLLTGAQILNCENDGVGIVESDLLSDEIIEKVNECKEKIISGDIVVTDVLNQ